MEKIIQSDIDNLADIIWWIKGYIAGSDADMNSCPFGLDHHESLRKSRLVLLDICKTSDTKEDSQNVNQQLKDSISELRHKIVDLQILCGLSDQHYTIKQINAVIAKLESV